MTEATALKLMIMSGPDDGAMLTLGAPKTGDSYIIGRREDCDVTLPYDSQVSREHVRLFFDGDKWFIQDLGSRNGTYVGKQKIDAITPLNPGEMFRVGRTWLRVSPDA
jgi:pSer/pThr/pTyr-binding forkhead associated (FHA) protein